MIRISTLFVASAALVLIPCWSMIVAEASGSISADQIENNGKNQRESKPRQDILAIIFVGGKTKTPTESSAQPKSQPPKPPPTKQK
jgi:hypothetical protein